MADGVVQVEEKYRMMAGIAPYLYNLVRLERHVSAPIRTAIGYACGGAWERLVPAGRVDKDFYGRELYRGEKGQLCP